MRFFFRTNLQSGIHNFNLGIYADAGFIYNLVDTTTKEVSTRKSTSLVVNTVLTYICIDMVIIVNNMFTQTLHYRDTKDFDPRDRLPFYFKTFRNVGSQ